MASTMLRRVPPPPRNTCPVVERVTPAIEAMAGAAGSELSRGGMQTKIEAAKIVTAAGTHLVIASGRVDHPLQAIAEGARCTETWRWPRTRSPRARDGSAERWNREARLTIDAGAVAALRRGNSLLPVGVIRVDGGFARGDAVIVLGPDEATKSVAVFVRTTPRDSAKDQRSLLRRHCLNSRLQRTRGDDPPR